MSATNASPVAQRSGRTLALTVAWLAAGSLLVSLSPRAIAAARSPQAAIAPTAAKQTNNWLAQIVGRYEGQIWGGGVMMPGLTEFAFTEGRLAGSYQMYLPGLAVPVPGTLTRCQALGERTLQCQWNDPYGVGTLKISFAPDFSEFAGSWSSEGSREQHPWQGSRL